MDTPLDHGQERVYHCNMIVLPRKEINPISFNADNIINVSLGNLVKVPVLIDTGSQINFLPLSILVDIDPNTITECELGGSITLRAACGDTTKVTHHIWVPVNINDQNYNVEFYAAPYINQAILGSPFCRKHGVVIDFSDNSMSLPKEYKFQIDTLELDINLPPGGRTIAKGILPFPTSNYMSSLAGLTLEVLSLHHIWDFI